MRGAEPGRLAAQRSARRGPCPALGVRSRAPRRRGGGGRGRAEAEGQAPRKRAAAGPPRGRGQAAPGRPTASPGRGRGLQEARRRRPSGRGPSAARTCSQERGGPAGGPDYKFQGAQRCARVFPAARPAGLEQVAAGWHAPPGSGINKGETLPSAVTRVRGAGSRSAPPAHASAEPSARLPGTAACSGAAARRPAPLARPLSGGRADPQQCVRSPGVPERIRPPRADPSGSWGLGGGGGGAENWGAHLGPPGHGGEGGPEHLHQLEGGKM